MSKPSPELRKKLDKLVDLLTDPEHGAMITDITVCLRGPDSGKGMPSEQRDQTGADADRFYRARVARKMITGAVIRGAVYNGRQVGGQRTRQASFVELPPEREWDHYDKHVARAARWLGLEIRT